MPVPNTGIVSDPSVQSVGDVRPLPIDPNTDAVRVVTSSSSVFKPLPTSLVFKTTGAGETYSLIPASPAGSVTLIVAHLLSAAVATYWIQIHVGVAQPAAAAVPLLVGGVITPIGGNTQFAFPDGVEVSGGLVVVLSTAEDTYADPNAAVLNTTAFGHP